MGLLTLILAMFSSSAYRNLTIEQQRQAVVHAIEREAHVVLTHAVEQAQRLLTDIRHDSRFHDHLVAKDSAALQRQLNQTSRAMPVELAAFDLDWQLIAASPGKVLAKSADANACNAASEPVTGLCTANGRPYYTVTAIVGKAPVLGYVRAFVDPIVWLQRVADRSGMPVRVTLHGKTLYQSLQWPALGNASRHLIAEYKLALPNTPLLIKIAGAKDLSSFHEQLRNTTYLVTLVAVFVSVAAIILALMMLEGTALEPLRVLTEQLRKLRQDKRELGQRVEVGGNVEVNELAAGFNEMTTQLKELYESLEHMAFTDPLTRLPNRSLFNDRLEQAVLGARRDAKPFALFFMDLDHFKDVNDTLGHHIGDLILQQVGERLRAKLRKSDTVARMGGDEFAILLPTVGADHAEMAARMLLKALRVPFVVEGQSFEIGASIGIALYPDHGIDVNLLRQRADVAMYAAKNSSSGVAFYEPEFDEDVPNRLALMGELRQAVDSEEFVVYYQPKVELTTTEITGVEALVRWRHPRENIVLPDAFIPLMEQSGLIRSLTPWVVNTALQDCHDWRKDGFALSVSVNLSARDLQDPYLLDSLQDLVAACQVTPEWFELEITESAVMADPARAMEILSEIAAMGIGLSIDDFGTGYSSLGYLKRLPVGVIKIDRSFVIGMTQEENDATIVRSSIDLAHNMGLKVVAEGVETAHALSLLRNLGCDAAQGMFIGRPMPIADLRRWLIDSSWKSVLRN
ncbi:MAG: putative bifunctional diguanylate cyclase/phosphodiesterase [Acidiferrobacterales bacterium]